MFNKRECEELEFKKSVSELKLELNKLQRIGSRKTGYWKLRIEN